MNSFNFADELKEIKQEIKEKEARITDLRIKLIPNEKDPVLKIKLEDAILSLNDLKARLALYDKSITSAPQSSKIT